MLFATVINVKFNNHTDACQAPYSSHYSLMFTYHFQLNADVAFFNESMHPVDVDLEQFVLVMETVVELTVENDINPDDAHKTMSVSLLLNFGPMFAKP